MSLLGKKQCKPRFATLVASVLLMVIPLLAGCGGAEGDGGGNPVVAVVGSTASLEWNPVQDPSISHYFVYYGRQSSGQPGSCNYESSVPVETSSATITNLDPETRYYFSVSAFNGLESPCSNEVSTITPPV